MRQVHLSWQVHPTPHLYSLGGGRGSSLDHNRATACFGSGFNPESLLSLSDNGPRSNILCHWGTQQAPPWLATSMWWWALVLRWPQRFL